METSLIGKALVFGSMQCGFESLVSNIPYYTHALVINHINLISSSRRRSTTLRYNKKALALLAILKKLGVINSCVILSKSKKLLKISPLTYKKTPFFKHLRLVSTPSKSFTVRLSTLKILNASIGQTIIILETSKGLMTHQDALKKHISGRILCVIT